MGRLLIAALAAACVAPAFGADAIPVHPALNDRFYFGAGVFYAKTTTEAQLTSSQGGAGTVVNFEQSLDMQRSKAVPSLFARWRLGERWRIDAEYFEFNRSATRTIDADIQWGDQVFPVNSQVQSTFDFSDLRVSAGYSFFRTKDKELGVALGFHLASYDVRLSTANLGSEGEDVLAPLPVLSVYGQFALTDRWAVGSRLDRFSLSYDKYDGSLTSLGLDILYQPFRNVGFGAGYRGLFIRMDAEGDNRTLSFRQSFEGPTFFVNASF